jgi:AcrR family transcriptional regulator
VVLAYRRRKIIDALASVCAEKGYAATTIKDVVARSSVSRPMVYAQFSNKGDIATALMERGSTELFEVVEEACRGVDGLEAVERGLEAVVGWVERDPVMARACLVERYEVERADELQKGVTERFIEMLRTRVPVDRRRPKVTEEMVVGGVEMMLRHSLTAGALGERDEASLRGLRAYVLAPFTRTW